MVLAVGEPPPKGAERPVRRFVAIERLQVPGAGNAIGAIRALRERPGRDLQVFGSSDLSRQLVAADLVDEYVLMIEPILLGGGKRAFPDDGVARTLELVSTTVAATGVIVCTYRPVR